MDNIAESKILSLVINAASGIGYEISKLLAIKGHDLLLIDQSPALVEAAQVCQSLGAREKHLITDLSEDIGLSKTMDLIIGSNQEIYSLYIVLDFNHANPQRSLFVNLNASLMIITQLLNMRAKQVVIIASNGHSTLLHQCIKNFLKQYCFGLNKEIDQRDFIAFTFYLDDLLASKKNAEELALLCFNNVKHAKEKRFFSYKTT